MDDAESGQAPQLALFDQHPCARPQHNGSAIFDQHVERARADDYEAVRGESADDPLGPYPAKNLNLIAEGAFYRMPFCYARCTEKDGIEAGRTGQRRSIPNVLHLPPEGALARIAGRIVAFYGPALMLFPPDMVFITAGLITKDA